MRRRLQRIHRCRHVLVGDVAPLPQRFGSCREILLRQRSPENVSTPGFSGPAAGGRPAFERADCLVADSTVNRAVIRDSGVGRACDLGVGRDRGGRRRPLRRCRRLTGRTNEGPAVGGAFFFFGWRQDPQVCFVNGRLPAVYRYPCESSGGRPERTARRPTGRRQKAQSLRFEPKRQAVDLLPRFGAICRFGKSCVGGRTGMR